jgi:hypothetical protein
VRYSGAPARVETIGQECDPRVRLVKEERRDPEEESDLILSDDAAVGHEGGWK